MIRSNRILFIFILLLILVGCAGIEAEGLSPTLSSGGGEKYRELIRRQPREVIVNHRVDVSEIRWRHKLVDNGCARRHDKLAIVVIARQGIVEGQPVVADERRSFELVGIDMRKLLGRREHDPTIVPSRHVYIDIINILRTREIHRQRVRGQ